jgi:hypothetical protein
MNSESPMNIRNCQLKGSFQRFTIHQQKSKAIRPMIITDMPLKGGLVLEKTRKSIPRGSITGYFITEDIKVELDVLKERGKLDILFLLEQFGADLRSYN